jgi:site-specific recombinase XerD
MQKQSDGRRRGRRLPVALTEDEVEALVATVNTSCTTGLRNRAMLAAMLGAGLRVSEVCALRGADVDLQKGTVRVNLGKGRKDRVVPVDQQTRAWLQAWAEKRDALGLNGKNAFFAGIRTGPTGKTRTRDGREVTAVRARGEAIKPRYVQGLVARLAQAAGIAKRVTPHVLRHTYATRMLERPGMTIRDVQTLLGHANLATTQVYTHVNEDELRRKVQGEAKPPVDSAQVLALQAELAALQAKVAALVGDNPAR